MSVTVHFTEEKMKSGTRRLLAELRQAGVNIDALGYNKALHVFSKAVLDKPYEEIKGAFFDKTSKAEKEHHSVFILACASNDILVLDGEYVMATNVGTDLEVPYSVLEAQAEALSKKYGVTFNKIVLPEVLFAPETDDEWVNLARDMGYFEAQGSIFDHLTEADQILVAGKHTPFRLDGDWFETLENSEDPDGEVIWHPEAEEGWNKYEWFFTFGELKRAKYQGAGKWLVPNAVGQDKEEDVLVSFLNIKPVSA